MAEPRKVVHATLEERRARGKAARKAVPPGSSAGWKPAPGRADPVALLQEQNEHREQDLVPVRNGRMLVSPFTFYRGAARVMAADLAATPVAGLDTQVCGDAHLSNFGAYAAPSRQLVFDLNDFDETLPGPFEYDVKRMAASFTIAARDNGLEKAAGRAATLASVASYAKAVSEFAEMRTMYVWYARITEADIMSAINAQEAVAKGSEKKQFRRGAASTARLVAKAHTRDSLEALSKLTERVDGTYRIVSRPPLIVPVREVDTIDGFSAEEAWEAIRREFRRYRSTLQADRRLLLERFEVVDMARKVVGVGSVGTRCSIILLQGRDQEDPLFLQVKEATRSVLEEHLPRSRYQPGARVVHGQRLMQAASDIYLGWTRGYQAGRFMYVRQLRDWKASAAVDTMGAVALRFYADLCGWTLARAHSRSGDPVALAAYLKGGGRFSEAIADFAERYADQNERDYDTFAKAVKKGRIKALEGV
jgi:uncharacterized protein (DUF2252 family)